MDQPNLIFVVGESATGKTTLANKIALELSLPVFSKDSLKVILFDNLGWKDRQWSKEVGKASIDILDYIIEENLKVGNSLVIENVFHPKWANPKFQKWQAEYNFNAVQVLCYADDGVVIERFKERAMLDSRHTSFVEGQEGLRDLQTRLQDKTSVTLDLKGRIIKVDTSDFNNVEDKEILKLVKAALV
jgi:2-phosphoglycerate kinase